MAGSARDRVICPLEKRVINLIVLLAWRLGLPPPGDALLETTGRRIGAGWLAGTAHILDDDDPRERQRINGGSNLARRFCVCASQAMAPSPLTVRVDLDTR
jgi:hypothetical protein